MSKQITVKQLFSMVKKEMAKGNGDKKIVLADDTEGNGYHGMFFGFTSETNDVKECIEYSNGIYDSDTDDVNEIVILG